MIRSPTSFGYAQTGYNALAERRTLSPTDALLMLEVEQAIPQDFSESEYYIPSHVPPHRVPRFFVGFSSWYNVHEFERPPDRVVEWFEVNIASRDADGRPTKIEITPFDEGDARKLERRRRGKERWSSAEATSPAATAFLEKYPRLGPTIAEIERQLPPAVSG